MLGSLNPDCVTISPDLLGETAGPVHFVVRNTVDVFPKNVTFRFLAIIMWVFFYRLR